MRSCSDELFLPFSCKRRGIVVRDLPSGDVREWVAPGKVALAALDARGDRVAAGLRNGDIHVWRQPGGEELSQFDGGGELRALRFGADDATLVMADFRGRLHH